MKKRNSLIGKIAVIDCLVEQLEKIGIKTNPHVYPGKKVKIYRYEGKHDDLGEMYAVDDGSGISPLFFFTIPLKWLNVQE